MGWDWRYSGPATVQVEEIHKWFFDATREEGEDYQDRVRETCHDALRLDVECFPAHVALGDMDFHAGDYDGMMEHHLRAIDTCEHPLDSDMLIESIFLGLYEESPSKPEVWPYIATLWERIQSKQPRLGSIRSICIACRFSGDHSIAHWALDDWQRTHPEDSVKLAKLALKDLRDPRKAADILVTRLAGEPSDKEAERYLRKVNRRLE